MQEQMESLQQARDILYEMVQESEAISPPHRMEDQWRTMHRRAIIALMRLDERRRGESILDDAAKEKKEKEIDKGTPLSKSLHAPKKEAAEKPGEKKQKTEEVTEKKTEEQQDQDIEMTQAQVEFTEFMFDYITEN